MSPVSKPPVSQHSRLRVLFSCVAASSLLFAGLGPAAAAATAPSDAASIEKTDAADPGDVQRQEKLEQLSRSVDSDFYTPPASLPSADGALVRSEPADFFLDPVKLIRPDATVTRMMYKSTDSHGEAMAVTGTVLVPTKKWSGAGERPVIGYAVGTQGLADKCAPSRQMGVGQEYEGPMMTALLESGYALAITDYEGLGTPGSHTFMARASQGHALLDGVRAAQDLGVKGLDVDNPVALMGYSQGGGASAAAAELAPEYAPEMKLKGAFAGAVPADLSEVADSLDSGLYTAFLLFAIDGVGTSNGLEPESYLNAQGMKEMEAARSECTVEAIGSHAFVDTTKLTKSGKKLSDVADEPQFQAALKEQEIGAGRKPEVPVLLSHSLLDDVIPYATGRDLAKRWCAQGVNVSWDATAGPTHIGGYVAAVPQALYFLKSRFDGKRPLSSCWRL
ncbi:lipase family protein [Arthrobacter rhombi]|uniref:lipase family protein n=1 Tax=Arthrobacter rhombi TaxID=71253 RepID=UPI003F90B310